MDAPRTIDSPFFFSFFSFFSPPLPPFFPFFFVIFRRHAVGNTAACNTVKWIFRLTSRDRDRPTHHHHHHHRHRHHHHHRCPAKNSNALQKFIEVTDLSNRSRLLKHRVMPRFLASSRDFLSLFPPPAPLSQRADPANVARHHPRSVPLPLPSSPPPPCYKRDRN